MDPYYSKIYCYKCCPKCGRIRFPEVNEITICELCGTVLANASEPMSLDDHTKMELMQNSTKLEEMRKKHTLGSSQFDQEAWNRRVAFGDGNIPDEGDENEVHTPRCPTCGSTNVRHISGLNRGASIAMFGLFSGKIGKNYECLDCKARW